MPVVRSSGGRAGRGDRLWMGGAARHQRHGTAAVRQIVLPDRGQVCACGRYEPERGRWRLFCPSLAPLEGPAGRTFDNVSKRRLEAAICRTTIDNDPSEGTGPYSILAGRAGGDGCGTLAAGAGGGRQRTRISG